MSETELLSIIGFSGDASRPIAVEADLDWVAMVETLQKIVLTRFRAQGITVEANPTSNLLIGGYGDYAELPYGRIVKSGIRLSLNTDDPGLFQTTLPGEFERLARACVRSGIPRREIATWLAERVYDARESTFLGAQTPVGSAALRDLQNIDEIVGIV